MSDMKQQNLHRRKMKVAQEEDQGNSKVTEQNVNMKWGKKKYYKHPLVIQFCNRITFSVTFNFLVTTVTTAKCPLFSIVRTNSIIM